MCLYFYCLRWLQQWSIEQEKKIIQHRGITFWAHIMSHLAESESHSL